MYNAGAVEHEGERSDPLADDVRMPLAGQMTLSGQFLLFGVVVLIAGMFTIGLWVQAEIRHVFIIRAADVSALYADSFMAHHVQTLDAGGEFAASDADEMDEHLAGTSLGRDLVAVKLWTQEGTIAYSTNKDLVGRTFPIDSDLQRAFSGEVVSRISNLSDPGHELERPLADSLIETYAPIFRTGTDETVAVAEFYQRPDSLLADISNTQKRGWIIVGAATVVMYVMLVGLARRASNLIRSQRTELEETVRRLSGLLSENQELQKRMQGAAGNVTALNEQYLHRISADLHDGPAQNVALAMLRVEALGNGDDPRDLDTINSALDSALTDIRSIARGLRLPEIDTLSPADTARRVIRSFERTTRTEVDGRIGDLPDDAPLSVRITLYRILQEALANSYKHAPGASRRVRVMTTEGLLVAEIRDDGPGFDPGSTPREGSLGLNGMSERIEMLGGTFEITSRSGEGTEVRARIPLPGGGND